MINVNVKIVFLAEQWTALNAKYKENANEAIYSIYK